MAKTNSNGAKPQSGKNSKSGSPRQGRGTGDKRSKSGRTGNGGDRQQPKKDSDSKRVNLDNAREDKVADQIMKDAKSGRFNDINDFIRNPELTRAAASIPVAPILGYSVGTLRGVQGVIAINWVPNFGNPGTGNPLNWDYQNPNGDSSRMAVATPWPVALNQAADQMYSYIVHANSRDYRGNSSDYFMLMAAGWEVFSIIEAMKRAYGVAKYYVETNGYYPDALLAAMGFIGPDLRDELSHAWYDINNLIMQTRQIWVPNKCPILSRYMELNSNIYKDADGPYAQTYVFARRYYYKFNETKFSNGGCLEPATLTYLVNDTEQTIDFDLMHQAFRWKAWVKVAQSMIDALVSSEDRGIMYGNLLNAYGAENIFAMPEMSSDYIVLPEYTPEVAMQIENLTIWSDAAIPNGLIQDGNKIGQTYKVPYTDIGKVKFKECLPTNWSLNFHIQGYPTPEMILLATRFTTLGTRKAAVPTQSPVTPSGTSLHYPNVVDAMIPCTAGSEIVTNVSMIQMSQNYRPTPQDPMRIAVNNIGINSWACVDIANIGGSVVSTSIAFKLEHLMSFDWHPFVGSLDSGIFNESWTYQWEYTQLAVDISNFLGNITYTNPILPISVRETMGDHDVYTDILWQELEKINNVCFFSLYGVPQM